MCRKDGEGAMTYVLVAMNGGGQMTIPVATRRQLGLDGEARLQAEVLDGALVLRPAAVVPREDAWAYTPEHLKRVARARREDVGRQLTEADLDRLAPSEA